MSPVGQIKKPWAGVTNAAPEGLNPAEFSSDLPQHTFL